VNNYSKLAFVISLLKFKLKGSSPYMSRKLAKNLLIQKTMLPHTKDAFRNKINLPLLACKPLAIQVKSFSHFILGMLGFMGLPYFLDLDLGC
jgi:hypothetical protein